jgi:GAF domain-containing protein
MAKQANTLNQILVVLKNIEQTLVTIEDLPKTLEVIAHSAKEVLDADIVDLYQYVQARNEVILPPILVGKRKHPHIPKTQIYEDDVVMKAVRLGEPQYFSNTQGTDMLKEDFTVLRPDAPKHRFVVREGVVSSAIIPLIAAGETVGVMFINYRARRVFNEGRKNIIESFARLAAMAIHKARFIQL